MKYKKLSIKSDLIRLDVPDTNISSFIDEYVKMFQEKIEGQIKELLRLTGLDVDSVTFENAEQFYNDMKSRGYELKHDFRDFLNPFDNIYGVFNNEGC
jgi:hypothetical protein